MSLKNLVGISLESIAPDGNAISRLISAAERNIADSQVKTISDETRFDAAYKAIMQLANTALRANGYRTLTNKPGHHMTMIQCLSLTIGSTHETIILLDTLRKQRNAADYTGDIIPRSSVLECISQSQQLLTEVTQWIMKNKPELMDNHKVRN